MNRIIGTLLLMMAAFMGSSESFAQLRYGFRFGGDFAASHLKDASDYKLINRSGFEGGLTLEYQVPTNGFAIDIAAVYARHNTRLNIPSEGVRSFGRNFIDLPLHFKYKFWLKSTHELFAPMIYTGPALSFRLDHNDSRPLATNVVQPGWDFGIGFDAINFIQLTAGYRLGLGNSVKRFEGCPDAVLRTDGWNVSANIYFDF